MGYYQDVDDAMFDPQEGEWDPYSNSRERLDAESERQFRDEDRRFRKREHEKNIELAVRQINKNNAIKAENAKLKIGIEIIKNEQLYISNKKAKVGSIIKCANSSCNKEIRKNSYQQAFCCTKCKDKFWNQRDSYFGNKKMISIK
jgi:hypothetical protein